MSTGVMMAWPVSVSPIASNRTISIFLVSMLSV
jgi:hypothetical protein